MQQIAVFSYVTNKTFRNAKAFITTAETGKCTFESTDTLSMFR